MAQTLRAWSDRVFRSTGDSAAHERASDAAATQAQVLLLPDASPAWASEAHTASAVASDAGYPLRTARQAEKAARDALRREIASLKIDPAVESSRTFGQAAGAMVDAAVDAAKIAGVDYRADGSVEVSVSIDGQRLWQAMQLSADAPRLPATSR